MKLLVIGCGNMGGAIVRAVLDGGHGRLFESVTVVDPSEAKLKEFKEQGCEVATSLKGLRVSAKDRPMAGANTMVVLAVKPQDVDEALAALKKSRKKLDGTTQSAGSFLVSIAAGVSMDRLKKGLGDDDSGRESIPVVRVMPNMPAQVGLGASGWMAAAVLTAEQKSAVVALLDLLGVSVEVSSEDELDAVTALSGSGPAYVFYFMEALVEGAEKLGLPREAAMRLAVQTVKGAAALAEGATLEALKNLRAQVTSKGGTTEQAIGVLEKAAFKTAVHAAMRAAYEWAKKMR